MSGTSHLKYMILGGVGVFVLLLLFGAAPQSALFVAIALACPLMMVFMMGDHSSHSAGHDRADQRDADAGNADPHDARRHH